MNELQVVGNQLVGHKFIEPPYLPEGQDEHYLRNAQLGKPADFWRDLADEEIKTLLENNNVADDWKNVRVAEGFDPKKVRNCQFYGLVRIGRLDDVCLAHHDMVLPVGITNSRIISCDIGDDVAIDSVRYLAHYIIGDNAMLLNLDEMHMTNHAKFGNGIIKDGEDESVRIWLDLINEAGGRKVMPFDGMIAADAYLWARYRQDEQLIQRLGEITQGQFDSRRGFYGSVGSRCVIKNCRIIKDVKIGPCAYIKGVNKLKNLTINSSAESPTQIGEGVELVNGIIGYGCHVFYGCKAVRFILGDNSNLKYGARLIHSYLGDNSTVSCCEMLNNLIFPAHEQHHNNSFLIATLVMGQSNIAAGATIGSNHNSRAPDGEVHAGRGFWPGLCVSLKHNCKFASFTLLAKGHYPVEINMPLPFSLISREASDGRLRILPAYWWLYNQYALARNTWKFSARDKREVKRQNIEFDSLAPDTVEEIFTAADLLAKWTARAQLRAKEQDADSKSEQELIQLGRQLLSGPAEIVNNLEIVAEQIENSPRTAVILKAHTAWRAYRQMLHYYAVKNLLEFLRAEPKATLKSMCKALAGERQRQWVNLGGQIMPSEDLEQIKVDIKSGKLPDWSAIHAAYDKLWERYTRDKQRHALATLLELLEAKELTGELWSAALDEAVEIQKYIAEQTYLTRKKDYDNTFTQASYDSPEQMRAVLGTAEENSFVKQLRGETEAFAAFVEAVKKRG